MSGGSSNSQVVTLRFPQESAWINQVGLEASRPPPRAEQQLLSRWPGTGCHMCVPASLWPCGELWSWMTRAAAKLTSAMLCPLLVQLFMCKISFSFSFLFLFRSSQGQGGHLGNNNSCTRPAPFFLWGPSVSLLAYFKFFCECNKVQEMELPLFSKAVQHKFAKDEGGLLRQRTS